MSSYIINGPIDIGNLSTNTKLSGYLELGGVSNTVTLSSNGGGIVGGVSNNITCSAPGSIMVGGNSKTSNISGVGGHVVLSGGGTVGVNPTDSGFILIGGENTTIGKGSSSVCIGYSTTNVVLQPQTPKLFVKGNPIGVYTNTGYSIPGTITANDISNGIITISTAGNYTLPSTANLLSNLIDQDSGALGSGVSPSFECVIHNVSVGTVNLSTGAGQSYAGYTSPLNLTSGTSVRLTFWFSNTTTTFVNVGSYSVAAATTTLTNLGTVGLVSNGTGPALTIKGLVAGSSGITVTSNATDVIISNPEPWFTTNSRFIIGGTNTTTNVNSGSFGGIIGGITNNPTVNSSSGGVVVGGNSNTTTISGSGGVSVGGNTNSTVLNASTQIGGSAVSGTLSSIGSVVLGGASTTYSVTTGIGTVCVGGNATTSSITNTSGSVVISSGCTITGSSSNNIVAVGGANTTITGQPAATQVLMFGVDTTTQTFSPTQSATFFKGNFLTARTNFATNSNLTLTTAQLMTGLIIKNGNGNRTFTLPDAADIYNDYIDTTGGFSMNINFDIYFLNAGNNTMTIGAGAGITRSGSASVTSGNMTIASFMFTSATTATVRLH